MDMPKVPFEQVHPRSTWPIEECERCGEPCVVRPDHPGLMVAICDACKGTD